MFQQEGGLESLQVNHSEIKGNKGFSSALTSKTIIVRNSLQKRFQFYKATSDAQGGATEGL